MVHLWGWVVCAVFAAGCVTASSAGTPNEERSVKEFQLAAGLRDEVVVIDFESIVSSYDEQSDLFRDPAHLNEAGQQRLARTIADAVAARIGADRRGAMSARALRDLRLDRAIGAERSTAGAP